MQNLLSYFFFVLFFFDFFFFLFFFFFSSRRRHTRSLCEWSSDVCSSDLTGRDSPRRRIACATCGVGKQASRSVPRRFRDARTGALRLLFRAIGWAKPKLNRKYTAPVHRYCLL